MTQYSEYDQARTPFVVRKGKSALFEPHIGKFKKKTPKIKPLRVKSDSKQKISEISIPHALGNFEDDSKKNN